MTADAPVIAEVVRSGFVESVHHGCVFAVDGRGDVFLDVGATEPPASLRSCLKPLQAVAMVRAGLRLDTRQLALVCSSHSGLAEHVSVVRSILEYARLGVDALRNTVGRPLDDAATEALVAAGAAPDRVHHNCSGKHAGMLATSVANDWPVAGYLDPDHPVQRAIRVTVEELTGDAVATVAVDGCGAPLFMVSMRGLTRAYSRLARAAPSTPEAAVAEAMRAHPELVAGPSRLVTRLMTAVPGSVAKDGAEGAFAVGLPDGSAVTVRIADGASRAVAPVTVAVLRRLGVDVDELGAVPVRGGGAVVGNVQAVLPG